MEKIEADIFNILHNTKIRLQSDAEDNYGFMGKGYAEKLAIEISKVIQPSEKKALSVEDIKSIAIKATRKIKYPDGKTEYSLWLSNDEWTTIAQAIFDALPNEKKALSVEDMKKIAHEAIRQENVAVYSWKVRDIICHAIHSAMPARKEVKWPEKIAIEDLPKGITSQGKMLWNQAIESCMQAYEEALPAQSLLDEAFINGKKESRQEIFEAFQRCVDRLSIGGNTANSFNSQINYIKSELFDGCIPAKREVRYPEKRTSIGPMGDDERDMLIWNSCIDEFKKLNGG